MHTIGFYGLGLIGGSIARAIREKHPGTRIIAYAPDRTSLAEAYHDGVADLAADGAGPVFTECDIIFLCAPVERNEENLKLLAPYLREDAILTDVGSVKSTMHRHVRAAGLSSRFIGGHPMTGSERIGYRNSKARFLENAFYILAPEPEFPEDQTAFMESFVRSLGAIPLRLDSKTHDLATAAISHLPHVVSASLVNLVRESDRDDGLLRMLAAGGFKDITRIASSSPVMWEQICLTNTGNILELLDRYVDLLQSFRDLLTERDGDRIRDFFSDARTYRDSFADLSSGPIRRTYIIHADIEDHPGVIAAIVQLLAADNINIRNLGISHNREYQEGVLRMEFDTQDALDRARVLLADNGYTLH